MPSILLCKLARGKLCLVRPRCCGVCCFGRNCLTKVGAASPVPEMGCCAAGYLSSAQKAKNTFCWKQGNFKQNAVILGLAQGLGYSLFKTNGCIAVPSVQQCSMLRPGPAACPQLHDNSLTRSPLASDMPGRAAQETSVLTAGCAEGPPSLGAGQLRRADWIAGDKNPLCPLIHITSLGSLSASILTSYMALGYVFSAGSLISPAELLLMLLPSALPCSSHLIFVHFLMNLG